MPYSDAALNVAQDAIAAVASHIQLHTDDPGASGTSNTTTAGRQAASWSSASGGDLSLSSGASFTGGAASGPVTWVSLWSASTSGTFYGRFEITTGDEAFNAAGEYDLDDITVTGS